MAPKGNKRRMPDAPTPEMLKRMRTDEVLPSEPVQHTSNGNGKAKARTATVEDAMDEDEEGDFAPGGDPDYYAEEDEEGRFFGSGLSETQKDILNLFDGAGNEDVADELVDELNIAGIRRMLLKFDRAAKKNQDQRSKFPDDPTKFIDSEADLDAAIQSLLPLAQSPVLAYPELVNSGTILQLIDLMSHENVDIVIDVVALLHELTDEDVGDEGEEDEDDEMEEGGLSKKNAALKLLVDSLTANQTMDLLVANLSRMNEEEESDRQGVYHTLGIFENTIGFNPELATTVMQKTSILKWLLARIQWKKYDENKGYVAELLPILLQGSQENRLMFGKEKGLDVLLQVLSQYRRRDPADADEVEFMENVFDALCAILAEPENKASFLEEEGVELMVLIMKEKMLARSRSIKVLDYVMSGPAGKANCERFVEALGLKTLFSAFMNKGKKGKASAQTTEDTGHILGILSSLFSNLDSDSVPRIRLLSKFTDSEYEKVDRLLDLRDSAVNRLRITDREIAEAKAEAEDEEDEDDADMWELRRLDGGLFTLQTVDYILGWICMEDDGIRAHAQTMLARKSMSLKDIVKVLQAFRDSIGDVDISAEASTTTTAEPVGQDAQTQRAILQGLIDFLDSC
ncbi:DUF1716-domain-containing protein [Clavulina sp. PMI_390]|nr:DUF1716-domain-containing protein [Clavulina sp. PMI_390]